MKCNRYAIYGWRSDKSKLKYDSKVLFSSLKDEISAINYKRELLDKAELCEGEIISQVELEFIPYYGGADPNVEVRFKCKKCGYEYANENGLPYDLETLNKFLTEVISKL